MTKERQMKDLVYDLDMLKQAIDGIRMSHVNYYDDLSEEEKEGEKGELMHKYAQFHLHISRALHAITLNAMDILNAQSQK